jgi:glycine/D-amino acid oxidase-like deaminating enzyme
MLGAVRPSGARRSRWLRDALAAEPHALRTDAAAPPLRGDIRADVAILGGGYTGLWTAYRLTELDPGIRIVVLEADVCGGGPSGRNGGFVTGWYDELPTLIERHGPVAARDIAVAMAAAVDEVGAWCTEHGVDAWFRKAGMITASAAPAQDDAWGGAVEACRAVGLDDAYVPMTADEVRERVVSPVLRAGVFMRDAATIQPAALARALRRVLLERGVVIYEETRARPVGGGGSVRVVTASPRGGGTVQADSVVVAVNAWAAAWPSFGRRLVTWSSYIALTEPIPDRLADLGWTGGEGLTDARFTLHYLRTTPDGRIAIGGGGGRAGLGGRIGPAFTDDVLSVRRAVAGLRRLFPSLRDVRIADAWGGPIDITSDHLPTFGTLPGGRIHFGHGYSGNGVAPAVVGGRVLAALALGRSDDPALALGLHGHQPRAFPPEPARYVGARLVREAIVRREIAEERGERPGRVVDVLSRVPRRLGYHLGPE